ncbi:MAG: DUF3536 domain-containing protein [Anaerolineaceae bacterium]|nr:DUF3536 domain-containing protein [Anaerolineaceae bacterium]
MAGRQAFCVHGHFYQPPREDPLTGEIPLEPGAAPYHNWNEKIHDQCYRPNAELENYSRISFNVGPTLLEWMENYDPNTLLKIVEQERKNFEQYGVGNGMAQAYNHTILPLSPKHDKITQVLWGIVDFEYRFGHKPEGMWLPETAVDLETLEVLAESGIRFTILAPWQAEQNNVDVSQPYWVELPQGGRIAVFFYQQDLSTRISFDPTSTVNADNFLRKLLLPKFPPFRDGSSPDQLLMIASDGELYGHHQPFRDKFLAYLMDGALKGQTLQATYPSLWLQQSPPTRTIRIRENTSWSCHHGVLRWSGVCGCAPHSEWKSPLRQALNLLAEKIDDEYLKVVGPWLDDPWRLRHAYIDVMRKHTRIEELAFSILGWTPDETTLSHLECLLAAQFERQRMFTSCGWFFDDFDRIEPRNNIAYAAQAVWLTYLATGADLAGLAIEALKKVKSWRSGLSADVVFTHHLKRASEYQKLLQRSQG